MRTILHRDDASPLADAVLAQLISGQCKLDDVDAAGSPLSDPRGLDALEVLIPMGVERVHCNFAFLSDGVRVTYENRTWTPRPRR